MDKPRHPQVTRPWKLRQFQNKAFPAHAPVLKTRRTLARNPKRG